MTYLHKVDSGHGSIPLTFHSVALAADPLACPKDAQHWALPAQILPCLTLVHIPCMVRELHKRTVHQTQVCALGMEDAAQSRVAIQRREQQAISINFSR